MIAQLRGKIDRAEMGYVVLDVGGVGYKVHTGLADIGKLGEQVTLLTHLAVREDALDLYGFTERESLEFFEELIKISGIGPKSALGILSISPLRNLKQAVAESDVGYLTKISGIGRKTAEKIILELRDKMPSGAPTGTLREESDALEALESLGYGRREASEALRDTSGTSSERVKAALKNLGKNSI